MFFYFFIFFHLFRLFFYLFRFLWLCNLLRLYWLFCLNWCLFFHRLSRFYRLFNNRLLLFNFGDLFFLRLYFLFRNWSFFILNLYFLLWFSRFFFFRLRFSSWLTTLQTIQVYLTYHLQIGRAHV